MTTRVALRALGHPGLVLALVVLVLDDHVLKQAYSGLVTAKLSDVAGLVVAPLLLAVPLTLLRVPRALPVAIGLTGLGFTLTKASAGGAAITSDIWSLTGIPTQMRADVTDLLALPALSVAWLVHRRAAALPEADLRRTVGASSGGILVRDRDGEWELLTLAELGAVPEAPNLPGRPEGPLGPVPQPVPTPTQDDPSSPHQTPPSLPPEPTCDAPTTVTVTPNPQNGPPTSYTSCP
jgi:hypothetical protein